MRKSIQVAAVTALVAALATPVGAGIEEGDLEEGKQIYNQTCMVCHGEAGDGKGPSAPKDPAPRDFTTGDFKYGGTDQDLFEVIKNGAASKGGSPLMMAWPIYTDKQIWGLVKYVRSLKK